eukprot:scaffold330_cov109-Isochrysis_galbana.AAC.6
MPSQVRTSPATSAGQMLGADRTSAPAARSMLYQSSGLCELGPHQCCASPHVLLSRTLRWALTSSDTWTRGSPSSSTATATSLVPSCPFPTPASEVCELPPARLDPPSSAPGRNAPWLRPIHEPSAGRDGGTGVLFHRSRVSASETNDLGMVVIRGNSVVTVEALEKLWDVVPAVNR